MALKVTFKLDEFRKQATQHSSVTREVAFNAVKELVAARKFDLVEEFKQHPVIQELKNHESLDSSSFIEGKGTLFGFIGFVKGYDPTASVLDLLERIYVAKRPKDGPIRDRRLTYYFDVEIPVKDDVERISPMPNWTSGSWVYQMETGISGITYYLFSREKQKSGRSQEGIQTESSGKEVQPNAVFKPANDYLPTMLKKFRKSLGLENRG